ncbi:transcriptional regulator [Sphaerisporangium melleum]|uniref:Transcriptional regulator n=1 Tax=Sphaerisporangium melleum TaxID=321316 RepID=A0A917VQA8_9ACTN|nr:helix-turn-helix transcriptional regulator [Sphaerisporangium melleum]GGL07214.1 transcriptional regulator [Sphaerisporangium melleum]GII68713.1 transcriptional regulator [Sphaerisporangium melleum]
MSQQSQLRSFLTSRRARLTPPEVGLPWRDGRRVAGLRREEIALLAGVSVDYYTRLEQGRAGNVSDQVLTAVADALRLDGLERRHLSDLVRAEAGRSGRRGPAAGAVVRARPALHATLQALDPVPALLYGPRLEVVGINRMGAVLFDDFDRKPPIERNLARWVLLDPKARAVYPDWEEIATQAVYILRVAHGRDARDPTLTALVRELSARSEHFARHWGDHGVFEHTHGPKRVRHEAVGVMTLNYETLRPQADPGIRLTLYTAPPGSPAEEKLRRLAEWARAAGTGAGREPSARAGRESAPGGAAPR